MIKYTKYGDHNVLVLHHVKGKTEKCPFCNRVHHHSPEDGHRCSHCVSTFNKKYRNIIQAEDGTELCEDNGYILLSKPHIIERLK